MPPKQPLKKNLDLTPQPVKPNFDDELLAPSQDDAQLRINQAFVKQVQQRSRRTVWWAVGLIVALAVAAILYGTYGGSKTDQTPSPDANQQTGDQTSEALLAKLGRHIDLPQGEQPTVAKVVDVEKLRAQFPFYNSAKNGDVLVVYSQWALVYDPNADRIVNVVALQAATSSTATASSGSTATSTPASGQASSTAPAVEKITVEIRNGSGVGGAAGKFAEKLKGNAGFTVLKTGNAAKSDYQGTVVVDLTGGQRGLLVGELSQLASGSVVSQLPAGEASSQANVVVIIGK